MQKYFRSNIIDKNKLWFLIILLNINQVLFGQEKTYTQTNVVFDTISFCLTNHNNISIKAVLGKKDTLDLMFHTAANSITLTTKATKKTKSIHWDSKSEVNSWGGEATSRYSKNNSIEIGKLKRDSLAVWEDENSGSTTAGKFGPNLFEGYVIEIDFDNSLIILYESLPRKIIQFLKMPLHIRNGNLYIKGTSTIGGVEYKNQFLIHSGYGGAILYDDKFVAESKIGEQIKITDKKELKDSFGNVLEINKGILPELRLENLKISDVPVGFFKGKIGKQQMSILGADILKRFNVIIDSKREHIYFKKNLLIDNNFTQF